MNTNIDIFFLLIGARYPGTNLKVALDARLLVLISWRIPYSPATRNEGPAKSEDFDVEGHMNAILSMNFQSQ